MLHKKPQSFPKGAVDGAMLAVTHKVMLHMALKRGLEECGLRGEEAVSSELMKIHMQNTFKPQHYADPPMQVQSCNALEPLLFLDEEKKGKIKGRMCADSSKQRVDFAKGEATSPTVTTYAVIITIAIDAHKGRDVVVINLPGAFLHVM